LLEQQASQQSVFHLYKLLDPITDELRYIGQTSKPLEQRLGDHLQAPSNVRAAEWFADLKRQNLVPKIIAIGSFSNRVAVTEAEIALIKASASPRLLNEKYNKKSPGISYFKLAFPQTTLQRLSREAQALQVPLRAHLSKLFIEYLAQRAATSN
jgi:hypothetical protein